MKPGPGRGEAEPFPCDGPLSVALALQHGDSVTYMATVGTRESHFLRMSLPPSADPHKVRHSLHSGLSIAGAKELRSVTQPPDTCVAGSVCSERERSGEMILDLPANKNIVWPSVSARML